MFASKFVSILVTPVTEVLPADYVVYMLYYAFLYEVVSNL